MKKFYLFFLSLTLSMSLFAEPFYVRVNGTKDYLATATGEADYQGRTQYAAACVALQSGDVLTCFDQSSNTAWAITTIDPYGAYTQFNATATGLTCNAAGNYNIYIKMK